MRVVAGKEVEAARVEEAEAAARVEVVATVAARVAAPRGVAKAKVEVVVAAGAATMAASTVARWVVVTAVGVTAVAVATAGRVAVDRVTAGRWATACTPTGSRWQPPHASGRGHARARKRRIYPPL